MKLYGWIPHTYPTLEMKFPKEDFLSKLNKLPQKVYCDDADPRSAMSVKFNIPEEFDYGITKIKTEIEYGEYTPSVEITVYSSGLVLLELDERYVRSLDIDPSGTDDGDGNLLDGLRYLIREPYFLLKKLYHTDVHHESDEASGEFEHPDDHLTVVKADDEFEAVRKIHSIFLRFCETNTRRCSLEDTKLFNKAHLQASGFIAYGLNFINVFRDYIGGDFDTYHESLNSCSMSLESIYTTHSNQRSYELNVKMTRLTWAIGVLTVVVAIVSLFS